MNSSVALPNTQTSAPPVTLPIELPTRQLHVDLSQGFGRHWFGGDAFKTAFYNALSMSFPLGEQHFIDAVRAVAGTLPADPAHTSLQRDVRDFCAQEATHRHLHVQYNQVLARQGLVNHWEARAAARLERAKNINPMHHLGITVAFEHYTAVLAEVMLADAQRMDAAEPAMKNIWLWHSMEETEHKAVAFDLYKAAGGNLRWRRRWFFYVTVMFATDALRQTANNLWHDGSLFKPSTWLSAARFFLGRRGWAWATAKPLAQFLRADFHPWQQNNRHVITAYAEKNATQWRVVR